MKVRKTLTGRLVAGGKLIIALMMGGFFIASVRASMQAGNFNFMEQVVLGLCFGCAVQLGIDAFEEL